MTKQRRKELERVDAAVARLYAAKDDPKHPKHEEAQQLSYKLANDLSIPAKTLIEMSSFWEGRQ